MASSNPPKPGTNSTNNREKYMPWNPIQVFKDKMKRGQIAYHRSTTGMQTNINTKKNIGKRTKYKTLLITNCRRVISGPNKFSMPLINHISKFGLLLLRPRIYCTSCSVLIPNIVQHLYVQVTKDKAKRGHTEQHRSATGIRTNVITKKNIWKRIMYIIVLMNYDK